jgi:putative ABC transport system permease protein
MLAARPEVQGASPVVEVDIPLAGRQETLQVLGLDVFSVAAVTPVLLPRATKNSARSDTFAEDAIFVSAAAQSALGVHVGDILSVPVAGRVLQLRVAGDVPGSADNRRLAVMDIAAVQNHFGKLGRLTRVDLRLREGTTADAAREALQAALPAGLQVEAPDTAVEQAGNLSRAYRVNLTMLAAMALLTGGFLVFSAQALSVVRRRTEFAFLRAIGLSRRQLFAWLLGEGAALGLIGGVLGVVLGNALAWAAIELLGGDLGAGYFAGVKPQLHVDGWMALVYVLLGVVAGIAGAWLPAREAATVSPAQALKSGDEAALFEGHGHPLLGLALLIAAVPACAIPSLRGVPVGGYLAVALLLLGGVMLIPWIAAALALRLPASRSVPNRLAVARLGASPGNAVIAAAGILTSVALAAAMAIMVASFRESVDQWLGQILPADIYMRSGRGTTGSVLDEAMQGRIIAVPGIAKVNFTRHDSVRLPGGMAPVAVIARPISIDGHELPIAGGAAGGSPLEAGVTRIWISEATHDLYGWQAGQRVQIPLAGRAADAQVAGVIRDYSRQTGSISINLDDYRKLTGDRLANDAAIMLAPGANAGEVAAALMKTAVEGAVEIAYPGQIRAISLRIFDRTFAVTYLLEAVAIAIGLAGVAASFAALAVARRREFGMLRHLGLTRRQIGWMLSQEGALAAGVGVLTGMLAGGAIGVILIEVVNRQSFHWSMDIHVPWLSLALFGACMVALAALSAVVAGRQAMQQDAVLAVREDW